MFISYVRNDSSAQLIRCDSATLEKEGDALVLDVSTLIGDRLSSTLRVGSTNLAEMRTVYGYIIDALKAGTHVVEFGTLTNDDD